MKSILNQLGSGLLNSLFFVLGLSIFSMNTLHGDEYLVTGVPAGDVLNVRSGASSLHEIVAKLKQGDGGITITGGVVMNGDTDWVPISFAGKKGWVRPKYLLKEDSIVPQAPPQIVDPADSAVKYPTVKETILAMNEKGEMGLTEVFEWKSYFREITYPEPKEVDTRTEINGVKIGFVVPGKGKVIESPYAKGVRIDVRDFHAWAKIVCPETGRTIIVPEFPDSRTYEKVATVEEAKLYLAGLWRVENSAVARREFGEDDAYLYFCYAEPWFAFSMREHNPLKIRRESIGKWKVLSCNNGTIQLSLSSNRSDMPRIFRSPVTLKLPEPGTKDSRFIFIKSGDGWIRCYH